QGEFIREQNHRLIAVEESRATRLSRSSRYRRSPTPGRSRSLSRSRSPRPQPCRRNESHPVLGETGHHSETPLDMGTCHLDIHQEGILRFPNATIVVHQARKSVLKDPYRGESW
ncbi:hypothetical protein A2U01_0064372, partial [Trifolium medium]|nr:hypothetical protein [Trifolium medium]